MAPKAPRVPPSAATPSSITSSVHSVNPPKINSWKHFPVGVIFIAVYDFLSSVTAYGERGIVPLYLLQELGVPPHTVTTILHSLYMVGSFLPLLGAVLADAWLGKLTLIAVPMIPALIVRYAFVFSTIPTLNMKPRVNYFTVSMILRSILGIGVNSSLRPFIGDQFVDGQEEMRNEVFSSFYLLNNVAALIALILFPTLRAKVVGCFGSQFCYPLAFTVGSIITTLAVVILYSGWPDYRRVPPSGTTMQNFMICVWIAIRQWFKDRTHREHWLDRADIRFSREFIDSVKAIFSLAVLFTPLPVYFSVYSQMSMSWTMQSDLLDGRLPFGFEILPDSMDVVNAILVIILIPLFDFEIYPYFSKHGMLKTPLQRMCTGGFFVAISFVFCAILNVQIEKYMPFPPSAGHADLMMINSLDCVIDIHLPDKVYIIPPHDFRKVSEIVASDIVLSVTANSQCPSIPPQKLSLNFASATAYSVFFNGQPGGKITIVQAVQQRTRHFAGNSIMRFIYFDNLPYRDAFLMATSELGNKPITLSKGVSSYIDFAPMVKYDLCWAHNVTKEGGNVPTCIGKEIIASIDMYKGAIVESLLLYDNKTRTTTLKMMFAYPEDHILILYQFPQYLFITIGEVMLQVTAVNFTYSEAPLTLKSVVSAMWLCTRSISHFIMIMTVRLKILAGITRESTAYFWYAAVMVADMTLFCFLSFRYKYKTLVFAES